jgi:hypothetical protein
MYSVDEKDRVCELKDVPQSSVGAPCPMLLAGEHHLHLAYYLQNTPPGWNGKTVRVFSESSGSEPCALVEFHGPYAHMFGPPNDEAFTGHPLASRGLDPYGVFEVKESSWIRCLERMNSVHPYHKPDLFATLKHFVFSFHDRSFECIAESFELSVHHGSVASVLNSLPDEV